MDEKKTLCLLDAGIRAALLLRYEYARTDLPSVSGSLPDPVSDPVPRAQR
jgi:hypothetical protein